MLYYFTSTTLAMVSGLIWFTYRVRQRKLDQKIALQGYLIVMIAALVGSRITHVIYEEPLYYSENPLSIFKVWQGGFVFFGGFILAFLSSILFLRYKKVKNIDDYLDAAAPIISVGYAIGRVGCFIVGCCYGQVSDVPWTVDHRHPTQLYAVFWDSILVLILLLIDRRRLKAGRLFAIWLILHAIGRIIMEVFRDDYRGEIHFVSLSTWISMMLIALGVMLFFRKRGTDA